MGNNSLIKLNQLISAFAASHEQIKRYYFEAEDNMSIVTTADQSFPVLYATLVPGSSLGFNQNIFNIRFYCFDIIEKGRENWLTINSDCHLILNDLYRFLVDGNYPFDVQDTEPVPIEWVNDGTLDYVAGLYIDLQIYADTYSDCYIPLEFPVVFSGETGSFVRQDYLTCGNILDCETLTDYIDQVASSGTTFSGGTIINNTTFQGDVIIEGTTSGDTAYFNEYFSGGTSLETIITNIAQSVSPTGGTPFDCSDLTGCTIITNLQQDVFELQTGLTEVQNSVSSLETDFYMMLNFVNVEQFVYRVPEQFAVINLENPLGLTATLKVNGSAYTTGTTISQYALFTVDVNSAGYIKLNCQKV